MARPPRLCFRRALFHIVGRGIEDKLIFKNDSDRKRYLHLLAKYREKLSFFLFAYALMDNHVHLLIQVNNDSISNIIHSMHTAYTVFFNKKYQRKGHLFQGRFYSSLVEKQPYLLEVTRYIHLNPVRAGIVERPEDWFWSSCRCYFGLEESTFVDTERALNVSGLTSSKYKAFLDEGLLLGKKYQLPVRQKSGLWFIGREQFINRSIDKLSK